MKKKLFIAGSALLLASVLFAKVALPPEHYCKNNPNTNTGICGISTAGVASCFTLQTQTTTKDCYDAVNTD
jgi:hypothetical protein